MKTVKIFSFNRTFKLFIYFLVLSFILFILRNISDEVAIHKVDFLREFRKIAKDDTFITHPKRNYLPDHGRAEAMKNNRACKRQNVESHKMEYTLNSKRVVCNVEENWVQIDNGTFHIAKAAAKKHGPIKCVSSSVVRYPDDDTVQIEAKKTPLYEGHPITSDAFRIKCTGTDGASHKNIHSAVSYKEAVKRRPDNLPENSLGLNVLMVGFDSVSRLLMKHSLPKTYEYLVNELKGVVLEGYNIIGDGTPQALLPILTGKKEEELPEVRRGFTGAQRVDGHPWIWNKFSKAGYVTQWGEDGVEAGTFNARMLGFKNPPVDYYMRPFYLAVRRYGNKDGNCIGSIPCHINMLNWVRELYLMYPSKRKFSFVFHSQYTHVSDPIYFGGADTDVRKFLQHMEENDYLNNTLFILMADHGQRYGDARKTIRGKYEERLPFMALRLPPWFEKKYPNAMRNLRANADSLTSPFDVHETLKSILDFSGTEDGKLSERGISLFKKIPVERTCAHAQIALHWCTCLQWKNVSTKQPDIEKAAEALVNAINKITIKERGVCASLTVDHVTSAVKYAPQKDLLKFKKSGDKHGRTADLSGDTSAEELFYQITIVTSPSSAMYEATVKYQIKKSQFKVNNKQISRINKYGNQPHCVMDKLPHLRPYCYCKVQKEK